jgi:hypothetical protein
VGPKDSTPILISSAIMDLRYRSVVRETIVSRQLSKIDGEFFRADLGVGLAETTQHVTEAAM